MSTTLLLLLLLPVFVPLLAKLVGGKSIDWRMTGSFAAVSLVIVLAAFYGSRGIKTHDYEILNGEVVSKKSERVSCSHSYSCNCRESCSGKSCTTTCDTCYEHSYDIDWNVYTNVSTFSIDRVDRQGVKQPQRWSVVQNGQPVAHKHSYVNYVKAVPESLFHAQSISENAKFAQSIPTYPIGVYDYQFVDRVIPVGIAVPDLRQWNTELALALRELGPKKQANVVIVMVPIADPNYAYALRDAWLNSKKNDIVVVIGSTNYPTIEWVRILSWTNSEIFKVQLRDDLLELKTLERGPVISTIHKHTMSSFTRRHMSEFAYLEAEIDPPNWAIITMICVIVFGNLGAVGFIKYEEHKRNKRWTRPTPRTARF